MLAIKDLTDGTEFESQFLIVAATKGITNQGRTYLNLTLQDATGTMEAKKWDLAEGDETTCQAGNVVALSGAALDYRGHLQIKVYEAEPLSLDQIDVTRFVPSSPVPEKVLEDELRADIDALHDSDLKTLTKYLLNQHKSAYLTYPAAVRNHHNFASGLLYHSVCMARLAQKICDIYPNVNRDYVVAGALLHDLGKVIELSGPVATRYTDEGKLLGHISIMAGEIRVAAKTLNITSETPVLLEHMILSHHTKPEFGSPIPPLTLEAIVLAAIDDFDAKMNIVDKAEEGIMPGEWTDRVFALDNRSLYVPKYDQNPNSSEGK